MKRADWVERLTEKVNEHLDTPFDWRTHNCATFAADCVLAMTDSDPMQGLRDRVSTPLGAARLAKSVGGFSAALSQRFGDPVGWAVAQRGDVCTTLIEGNPTIGVCIGAYLAIPGPQGLVLPPMSQALAVWQVR